MQAQQELLEKIKILEEENKVLTTTIVRQAKEISKNFEKQHNNILFNDFYKLWLEQHKKKIQTNTYQEYKLIMENHILPYFKGKKLFEITTEDIEDFYTFQAKKGLSSNYIIRQHANLYTAFKWAVKKEYIFNNPMLKVERPKAVKSQISNFYTIEQLIELLNISKGSKIYTPIVLAVFLGLRRSEIAGLKWESINFKKGTIIIKRKAYRDKNTKKDVVSGKLKTEASYRILPLPKNLLEYLRKLREKQTTNSKISGYNHDYCEFVCVLKNGEKINLTQITGGFRRLIYQNGLEKIRFHDLRHSCATMLNHLGYSMKQIQEWLGHSNFQTTANIYTHVDLRDKEQIAENIYKSVNITL